MTVREVHRLVVRSKFVPPQLPHGLVVRERLVEHLSTVARFTLVAAMPGYGKTVAVRQWIDTTELPVAWLSLDLLDGEPASFWSHLLLAIGSVVPGIDEEPAMLLAERGADDPLFLAALVAQLENSADPVVLVLDGLSGDSDRATLDGLALLVDRAGDTLRLVVTSRSNPALPLARWHSTGWLAELREEDLRLTDDEAIAIARRSESTIQDPDDIVALNRRGDGWPIGLHMALLSRQAVTSHARPASGVSIDHDRMLSGYLVADVLEAMSEQERSVARARSVVEWFDPDLCTQLVGRHGNDVVRQLLARGVFLTVVDRADARLRRARTTSERRSRQRGTADESRIEPARIAPDPPLVCRDG